MNPVKLLPVHVAIGVATNLQDVVLDDANFIEVCVLVTRLLPPQDRPQIRLSAQAGEFAGALTYLRKRQFIAGILRYVELTDRGRRYARVLERYFPSIWEGIVGSLKSIDRENAFLDLRRIQQANRRLLEAREMSGISRDELQTLLKK